MGIFGNIFDSNKLKQPVSLSVLGADIHSHLIPGIDDGSQSIEDSVEMVKAMYNLGYKKLITTPHIFTEYFKNTSETIQPGLERLNAALKDENIPVAVEAAAEYMYDDGLQKRFSEDGIITFGNKYVLIELSTFIKPMKLFQLLFDLRIEGYNPVLAHPERYSYWYNDFENFVTLKDREILFQINLPSLTGYYSPQVRHMTEKLIDNNMVEFAGTDLHNMENFAEVDKSRFMRPLEKLINSGKLLNNTL